MLFGKFMHYFKFLSWVMIYDKGYQDTDEVVSSVVTKTKGLVVEKWDSEKDVAVILDAADIVNPPLETNAFFISTHLITTPNQKPGRCPGVRTFLFMSSFELRRKFPVGITAIV